MASPIRLFRRSGGNGSCDSGVVLLAQGGVHALAQAHQVDRPLQQGFQLLFQVHRGEGGEGIEFDPHIHIAACRGHVAGGRAEQADAPQLVALPPFALALSQQWHHLVAIQCRQGG